MTLILNQLAELPSAFFSITATREDREFDPLKIGSNDTYRLLLDGHEPDAVVWKKFAASFVAAIDPNQRAKATGSNTQYNRFTGQSTVRGGHVTIATNAEAKAFEDYATGEQSLYSRVIQPSQNNEVVANDSQTLTINGTSLSGVLIDVDNKAVATSSRNIYSPKLNSAFLTFIAQEMGKLKSPVGEVQHYYGTTALLTASNTRRLPLDGGTVGNATSGATHASNDYEDVFTHLGNIAGHTAAVIANNWATGLTYTLPDASTLFPVVAGFIYTIQY